MPWTGRLIASLAALTVLASTSAGGLNTDAALKAHTTCGSMSAGASTSCTAVDDNVGGTTGDSSATGDSSSTCSSAPAATCSGGSSGGSVKSAMVIVEPRKHGHLAYVLANFDANMPPHYAVYIFHGRTAGEFARAAAGGVAARRAVHYVPLPVDNLDADGVNALLKSVDGFWARIDAEHVLVFQTDSVLCGASPYRITDFEWLGYVGCIASPDADAGPNSHWLADGFTQYAFWGSGGLSLRRKSAALACLAAMGAYYPPKYPEDTFFARCVTAGYGAAPPSAAWVHAFCTQDSFQERSFGAHRIHDRLGEHTLDFLVYCPEAVPLLLSGPNHNLTVFDPAEFWSRWRQARFPP